MELWMNTLSSKKISSRWRSSFPETKRILWLRQLRTSRTWRPMPNFWWQTSRLLTWKRRERRWLSQKWMKETSNTMFWRRFRNWKKESLRRKSLIASKPTWISIIWLFKQESRSMKPLRIWLPRTRTSLNCRLKRCKSRLMLIMMSPSRNHSRALMLIHKTVVKTQEDVCLMNQQQLLNNKKLSWKRLEIERWNYQRKFRLVPSRLLPIKTKRNSLSAKQREMLCSTSSPCGL